MEQMEVQDETGEKFMNPFIHDGAYDRQLGTWRKSMAMNTLLVKDPIGRAKVVRKPPPINLNIEQVVRQCPKKQMHVPDCLDWRNAKPSRHMCDQITNFLRLDRMALDEKITTAKGFTEFFKKHKSEQTYCYCYCNDLGMEERLRRAKLVPELPEKRLPEEESVRLIIADYYGHEWLLKQQARDFHQQFLGRVQKHVGKQHEVNRDVVYYSTQQHRLKRCHELANVHKTYRPLAPIEKPAYKNHPPALVTFANEKLRERALEEDALRKAQGAYEASLHIYNPPIPGRYRQTVFAKKTNCGKQDCVNCANN